ncbi:hypothetical protein Tco_1126622 [Tanacetum coccineum]
MDIVKDRMSYCGDKLDKGDVNLRELINLMKDMVHLLDSALVFRKVNAEGEKLEKANPDPDITESNLQGEQKLNDDKMANVQKEQSSVLETNSRQAPPISEQVPPLTTSSAYSLTPLRDENKWKGIATGEEPVKLLMPLIEQGGSNPKMLNLQQFIPGKKMSLEVAKAQLIEIKRLVDLKAEQEKTEQKLKALSNKELEAQSAQLAAYEAKRKRMLEEYNHYITFRVNPLPITKISYKIDKVNKFATLIIERNNQPLSLTVYIVVDGMHRNLIPPSWVEGSRWLVIREPKSGIFFYNGNFNLVFQREEEFDLATTAQLIRTQSSIQRGTPKAEEMYKKIELAIKARNDVTHARRL